MAAPVPHHRFFPPWRSRPTAATGAPPPCHDPPHLRLGPATALYFRCIVRYILSRGIYHVPTLSFFLGRPRRPQPLRRQWRRTARFLRRSLRGRRVSRRRHADGTGARLRRPAAPYPAAVERK